MPRKSSAPSSICRRGRRRYLSRWWGLLLAAGALGLAPATRVRASALDGALAVRSAYVNFNHGVIELNAQITYPLNPMIRKALANGVTLSFDIEAEIDRVRRFWFDADVVDVTLQRQLAYHVVTRRFVVSNAQTGAEHSFTTVKKALHYLEQVRDWPILVESQLQDPGSYTISVRAGVRRGDLPASLRALLFWTDDWQRESSWYTWALPG
jgi:hypothetical protein